MHFNTIVDNYVLRLDLLLFECLNGHYDKIIFGSGELIKN